MASQRMSLLVLAVALAAALILSAEAQSSTPACAQQLVPCANYMNSTNPPDTCCNPIREAVATERECLCNLYNTPGLLQSLGINVTQALQLTRACGVNADTGLCNASALSPSSPSTPVSIEYGRTPRRIPLTVAEVWRGTRKRRQRCWQNDVEWTPWLALALGFNAALLSYTKRFSHLFRHLRPDFRRLRIFL
ncbi:hypothetical protein CRG98_030098 [Punica granatum]|uniref:Bifunctional inhibitor/plant lipid transfer protein/seed storage helical domain-containing protein n=1 Tax=Punica granatum TaxID=22663 RepID=A0A2I0IZQ4_PUNGR|nr:hypothetical protein CRG98_030098 [Punica granatum]